jgi:uncharacterized protein
MERVLSRPPWRLLSILSKDFPDMKIQIGGLSEGVHHYQFEVRPKEIGLISNFTGEVVVDADLEKVSGQLRLGGIVRAEGSFTCDRCAGDFHLPVSATYKMHYVTEGGGFEGIDPAELQVISPDMGFVDIAEDVRQTVLLAVPLKLLCREDCRGLCPQCGRNLNEGTCSCAREQGDARWETLKSLKGSN